MIYVCMNPKYVIVDEQFVSSTKIYVTITMICKNKIVSMHHGTGKKLHISKYKKVIYNNK